MRVTRCTIREKPHQYGEVASSGPVVANDPVNRSDPTGNESLWDKFKGALEGVAARFSYVGVKSEQVRNDYNNKVAGLDKTDSAARSQIKADARAATPREVRAVIEARRPGLGPKAGSGGTANSTNSKWTGVAEDLGKGGRVLGAVGVAAAAVDIATSDNRARAVTANAGGALGGLGGGALVGGGIGLLGGPFAEFTVPGGAFLGSMIGGKLGYDGGEQLYDRVNP